MKGSGKRGMRTGHEQKLDRDRFREEMAEEKPRDNASKWFKHKAYDVKIEGDNVGHK